MFKLGTAYTWDWGTAAFAFTHFGKPPRLASEVVVNPEPEALNLVSLNVRLDMAHWLGGLKGHSILTLRVENLLDEDIWVPEFNRGGNPNSLLDGSGLTAYAGLTVNFQASTLAVCRRSTGRMPFSRQESVRPGRSGRSPSATTSMR
jgi:hypothetical protein